MPDQTTISIDVSEEPAATVEAILDRFVKVAELADRQMPGEPRVDVFISTGDGAQVEFLQVPKRAILMISELLEELD